MAREEPESLQRVANFKVGHRRFGSVTWREPVDVRYLDLDATLVFSQGSVEVNPPLPSSPFFFRFQLPLSLVHLLLSPLQSQCDHAGSWDAKFCKHYSKKR